MLRSRLIGVGFVVVVVSLASPRSAAQGFPHEFRICTGEFALCAASTCTPTGGTIAVNTATGTATFPAAECVCPILDGYSIADLAGGNMKGSCDPPGENGVWSLYAPAKDIPQAITDWQPAPAPPFACAASLGLGNQLANCFSFACVRSGTKNGVPVATCTCPLGESLAGTPVAADTPFVTQAGQCNESVCSQHPVSAPIPFEDAQGCLTQPAPSGG